MLNSEMEPVLLERIRKDATCIIIRVGLGGYELQGPGSNILVPESRVAYATVINDLTGEGYELVAPDEFAERTGVGIDEVEARLFQEGTLFGVKYGDELAVSLPYKGAVFEDIVT